MKCQKIGKHVDHCFTKPKVTFSNDVLRVICVTHRFAVGLLQKLHRLLPFVLFVLLTHLQRRSLLLVFYVLLVGKSVLIFNGYCLRLTLKCET